MIPTADRKFFWWATAIIIAITFVPHFFGWARVVAGDFKTYEAYNTFGAADTNVYYSYINQARHGAVLFENLFTGDPQRPVIFHPVWLVAGWFGAATTLPTPIVFHVFRLAADILLLLVVYRFCVWLGLRTNERRVAFLVIALSSGLGIFITDWQHFKLFEQFHSTDLAVSESTTFGTLYHSPLFPLSQALVILVVQGFITAFEESRRSLLLAVGGLVALVAVIHTYDLVTAAAVLGGIGLMYLLTNVFVTPKDLFRYLRYGLALLPFVVPAALYFELVLYREPAVAGWLQQNITLSPSIWAYLLGYGLLTPLAAFGVAHVLSQHRTRLYVVITWLVTSAVLIYFPYLTFQRRLSSGMHIPLAILAALGLVALWRFLYPRSRFGAIAVIGMLSSMLVATTIGIVVRDSLHLMRQNDSDHAYFYSADEVAAQRFLLANAGSEGVIYGDPWQSNQLSGLGLRTFIGHGHQTTHWEQKRSDLDHFFTDWTAVEQEQYFKDNGIGWLYYGPREQKLGSWDPDVASWLVPAFSAGAITVYAVR